MNKRTIQVLVPERHKRAGVRYVVTDDGIEVPVIDVTHPAFDSYPSDAEFAEIPERTLRGFEQGRKYGVRHPPHGAPVADHAERSSEGGAFEYGNDDEVGTNLGVLRDVLPADAAVVGTVLLDGVPGRAMVNYGRVALQLRTPDAFRALARSAGWAVEQAVEAAGVYLTVGLRKA